MNLEQIMQRFEQAYGPRQWTPSNDAVSVLVETILSQNTSDSNSSRAFRSLRAAFCTWEAVSDAPVDEIAQSIRHGGLAEIKAQRIKSTLLEIKREHGDFDLNFLSSIPLASAKAWLRQLPGVGPKTTGCVLLFALGRPALPVDTHIFRVSKRLGLIDSQTTIEGAHELLEEMIPPKNIYEFHLHLIEHGRRVCGARQPRCSVCVLNDICPSSSKGEA